MPHNIDVGSKLVINGFTINPIKDKDAFKITLESLFSYEYMEKHLCDLDSKTTHTNFLKKSTLDSTVFYIDNEFEKGLIGFVVLKNGYYTLKIVYSKNPAEIQLDMYINEPTLNSDLIIDHLCAPSVPFDGFGMFDYTFSILNMSKPTTIVSDVDNNIRYTNNKLFNMDEFNDDPKYSIVLNELQHIHCFYCDNEGKFFVFKNDSRKIVSVCIKHVNKKYVSTKELGHEGKGLDIRVVRKYVDSFKKLTVDDNNGNIISKNKKEKYG